ncbi:MAG: hypothetical protein ACRYG7_21290 [Janthinobacterium lividum]
MPSNLSNNQRTSQVLSSQVLREPLGQLVAGSLLLGGGFLLLAVGAGIWPYSWPMGGGLLLLGVALLVGAWRLATGGTQPLLLTLSPEALRLVPLGQGIAPGSPAAETIPLASVVAYKHWLSRGRVFSRHYLRLELAGGRVLRLAAPPGGPFGEPGNSVPLPELVAQLARWVGPATVAQLPFSQTAPARRLMQGSWLLLLVAPGLLGLGYLATGTLVLVVAGGYLLSYYQVRRQAGSPSA